MKVGILTFTRSINYGALLQCYALQQVLITMGYDAEVIDYKQPFVEEENALFSTKRFKKIFLSNIIAGLRYIKNIHKRRPNYLQYIFFKNRYIRHTKACEGSAIPTYFDIYIIGSDQLWTTAYTGGVDHVFWGDFKHKSQSKIFSYAISTTTNTLKQIPIDFIRKNIENFEVISLREIANKNYLESKLRLNIRIDIDPTLLAEKSIWEPMICNQWKGQKFIVMYQVRRLSWSYNHLQERAIELAKQMDCELIDLSDYKYSADGFVSAIYFSQAVITTSFHGTVFALNFHKPFVSYRLNDGHDGRCEHILDAVEALHCMQNIDESAEIKDLNWWDIDQKLDSLRRDSKTYLKSIGNL